mgnify:CR=1 FL=1
MKELMDYLSERSKDDISQKESAVALLEILYFENINQILHPLSRSESYKKAKDLVYLRSVCISTDTTVTLDMSRIKTDPIRAKLEMLNLRTSEPLSEGQKQSVMMKIVDPLNYVVTAVFLADIVQQARRSETLRWLAVTTLTFLATLGGLSWLFGKAAGMQ